MKMAVSPEQFDIMCRELILMELEGHDPEACTIGACKAAGIEPPEPLEPREIVIDGSREERAV